MASKKRVSLVEAADPLVLAVDIGSTASRGDVYDASGRPVEGGRSRLPHQFTARRDGTSEIDPDQIVAEVEEIVSALATSRLSGRVGGVALDTFASSLVGVGTADRAETPCFTYADSRCAEQVGALRHELDEVEVQQRTGCRLHTSYLAPRLRWLRESDPRTFARVRRWMSLGEYVYLKLLGSTVVGTSTAAWTGLLDRRSGTWDARLLSASGVAPEQLSDIRDSDQPIHDVHPNVARRWPALSGAAWFPVVSDGYSSSVGAGAHDASAVVAAVATSGAMRVLVPGVPETIPSGLWCYRVESDRSILGGAVNDVGRAVSWLDATVPLAEGTDRNELLLADPDPATPLVLPYLTGERSTGWAANARAVLAGVSASTTGAMLFRGTMEGVAISYGRIAAQLSEVAGRSGRVLASGRVTQDLPGWLQILADVLDLPVTPVTIKRSTLRGTALIAAERLAPDTPSVPPATGETYRPARGRTDYYVDRGQRFQALYDAVLT